MLSQNDGLFHTVPDHACVCTQSDTVGGSMHIVGWQSVNPHKEEEKETTCFLQANVINEAAAVEEYVLNVSIKFSGSFRQQQLCIMKKFVCLFSCGLGLGTHESCLRTL